ncbi:hypothetical protein ABVT39_000752 [Epinephelus coioides]
MDKSDDRILQGWVALLLRSFSSCRTGAVATHFYEVDLHTVGSIGLLYCEDDAEFVVNAQEYLTTVQKERAKFKPMCKKLNELKIKSHLIYPAKLKVFNQDSVVPQGINMELPAEELDLDEMLRADGWSTVDRRGDQDAVLADQMKILVQSLSSGKEED